MGNFGDMMKLMSRAKDIKAGMQTFKDELPKMEFSAASPEARVRVTISGDMIVKSVELTADAADDKERLERELAFAFNAAAASAKLTMQEKLKELTGGIGLDLPGIL